MRRITLKADVTCDDCPCCRGGGEPGDGGEEEYCGADKHGRETTFGARCAADVKRPKWCPLREGPIEIVVELE